MYINIKLPSEFGSFNQLKKENYPFNGLFTSYLAAVSRLGLALKMDVGELVGYIEDKVFEGRRVPDIPDGEGPVNIRYKLAIPEDAGDDHPGRVVEKYIGGSMLTNRMAVMYIVRMTLRMSAAYGTSLLRLERLVADLGQAKPARKTKTAKQEAVQAESKQVPVKDRPMPMPKVSNKSIEPVREPEPFPEPVQEAPAASEAAQAARAAVNELAGLAAEAGGDGAVETNPYLNDFL